MNSNNCHSLNLSHQPAESNKSNVGLFPWILSVTVPLVGGCVCALMAPPGVGLFGTFIGFQLLFLLIVATVTDITVRKIYNASTFTALLVAFSVNGSATLLNLDPSRLGTIGLASSLVGAAACFCIVFLAYQMTGCGAGDVKIAAAIGAMLGGPLGLGAVAYSYILAAFGAIICKAFGSGPRRVARALAIALGGLFSSRTRQSANAADRSLLTSTIPMAPYFAVGTIIAIMERML